MEHERSDYIQPYVLDGVGLERKNDELMITLEGQQGKDIIIYGGIKPEKSQLDKLIYTGKDATIKINLPLDHLPYYFKATINGRESEIFSERILPLTGAINFRDMGGYKTIDGKEVKWGKLFRGDHLFKLTESDIKILERLGLKTIIDFRSEHEQGVYPNKKISTVTEVYHCNPQSHFSEVAGSAINLVEENRKLIEDLKSGSVDINVINGSGKISMDSYIKLVQDPISQAGFKKMLQVIAQSSSAPSYQHCRGGKDRTGFGAMLVLSLLGVKEELIVKDYLITKAVREERNQIKYQQYRALTDNQNYLDYLMALIDTREEYIMSGINTIKEIYGSVKDYAINVLEVTESQIEQMKAFYLEDC